MEAEKRVVGLVGAGAMGLALLERLVRGGFTVMVYDPSERACEQARATGGHCVGQAEEIFASGAPTLICVASTQAFASTVESALAASNRGAKVGLVIETSTLDLSLKTETMTRFRQDGITMLDCPLSGTSAQARNGDLVVFASGDEDALVQCAPIFSAVTRTTIQAGDFGMGMKLKLLANLLVSIHSAAAAEMLALARSVGLDPELALAALVQSAGTSRMLEVRGELMIAHKYVPATGSIDILVKDGAMIADMARQAGCALPVFNTANNLYRAAQADGLGQSDIAGIHGYLLPKGAGHEHP